MCFFNFLLNKEIALGDVMQEDFYNKMIHLCPLSSLYSSENTSGKIAFFLSPSPIPLSQTHSLDCGGLSNFFPTSMFLYLCVDIRGTCEKLLFHQTFILSCVGCLSTFCIVAKLKSKIVKHAICCLWCVL